MSSSYFQIGTVENIIDDDTFKSKKTSKLYKACCKNRSFKVIGYQCTSNEAGRLEEEAIIVDCYCLSIGSRNKIGIKSKERLALRYSFMNLNEPYAVSALRKGFPLTVHQTFISHNEPTKLCIYGEPWSACERTWTPQKFLKRIIHWLTAAANNSLHQQDQDLEELFIQSPVKVFLPSNLLEQDSKEKSFVLDRIGDNEPPSFFGIFCTRDEVKDPKMLYDCIFVKIKEPITHSHIEMPAPNLLDLEHFFSTRDSSFIPHLKEALLPLIGSQPFTRDNSDELRTIIICHIPIRRSDESKPELEKVKGYVIKGGIKLLAINLNLATKGDGEYIPNINLIGDNTDICDSNLAQVELWPIEVRQFYTKHQAQKSSGINEEYSDFDGIIGGLGSLGSSLADIWSRECWGNWSYIDDDTLEPHNLIRHIAYYLDVGKNKAEVVHMHTSACHQSKASEPFIGKINEFSNDALTLKLRTVALIVDVTTSLDAPRDLSRRDEFARCVSVFISPSGTDSVMLFEDIERKIRLDILEYQYYRFIIQEDWGAKHLENVNGTAWVGAGCRDISTIMPYDIIKMHSGLLARQIRIWFGQQGSIIKVFQYSDDTGEIAVHSRTGIEPQIFDCDDWKIIYDIQLLDKVSELRNKELPSETGGALVGYRDQCTKQIYLVDALPAPSDSVQSPNSFVRGFSQLQSDIDEIKKRTALIVDYIGEWHSHPSGCSTAQSTLDKSLLEYLKEEMLEDELPVIMLIVGDGEPSFYLAKQG